MVSVSEVANLVDTDGQPPWTIPMITYAETVDIWDPKSKERGRCVCSDVTQNHNT